MRTAVILLLIISAAACERFPEPFTTTGSISGQVTADSSGTTTYGVRVKATGPYGSISIIAKTANYMIESAGNGTYDLEFSKEGYGTVRQYGLQVFGDETVKVPSIGLFDLPKLAAIPKFIKAYTVKGTMPGVNTTVNIDLAVTNLGSNRLPVLLFLSNNRNVAWNNYVIVYPGDKGASRNNIPYIWFEYYNQQFPFKSGTEVFIRGYICNTREYNSGGYLDTYHGIRVYSTLNKSVYTDVVSFIVP